MPILNIKGLTKYFGGLVALNEVNFKVKDNEILGIIGPNGAGKTTLINVISGIYQATKGEIIFNGAEITNLPSHIRCRMGIARTFQIIRPLRDFNLIENVMVGCLFGQGNSLREARRKAKEICEFMGLSQFKADITRLNVLELKKMEIACALATQPKILFLDEVMAGLSIDETKEMIETVRKIHGQGVTVCIIEHVMKVIKELTERVIVIDRGEIIAEGAYEKVSHQRIVINAYLGEED